MYQFDAGQDRLCPSKRFEPQHGAEPSFDIPVILLNQVVQIFTLSDGYLFLIGFIGVECCQSRRIGATFINSHHLGFTVMTNSLTKEAQGGGSVPFDCQQKVDGLTSSVYRAVQISPLAFDF